MKRKVRTKTRRAAATKRKTKATKGRRVQKRKAPIRKTKSLRAKSSRTLELSTKTSPERNPVRKMAIPKKVKSLVWQNPRGQGFAAQHETPKWGHAPKVISPTGVGVH